MKKLLMTLFSLMLSVALMAQQTKEEQIRQLVESYAANHRFSGNVLIAKGKKVLFEGSYGFANLEKNLPNTSATLFETGSLTKPMTALAILKLEKENKLKLDDALNKYLPLGENGNRITIQHLLNHSSGLEANIFRIDEKGKKSLMPDEDLFSEEELFDAVKNSAFKFEAGTAHEYNNLGYLLLAKVIEKVSGQPYAVYMKEQIFGPLKMQTAHTAVNSGTIEQAALAYDGLGSGILKAVRETYHPSWVEGAGMTTLAAKDLLYLLNAMQQEKVVSLEKLFENPSMIGKDDMQYGYGWVKESFLSQPLISHQGGLPGYSAFAGFLPESKWNIVILSNATYDIAGSFVSELSRKIMSTLLNQPAQPLAVRQQLPLMAEISGEYELDKGHHFTVKYESGHLWLDSSTPSAWSLFDYHFSLDIEAQDAPAYQNTQQVAQALSKGEWEKLPELAEGQMKEFFANAAQMEGIWKHLTAGAGEFISWNIYLQQENKIHVRFHYDQMDLGLIFFFNKEGKVMGMFKDAALQANDIHQLELIPTALNHFMINGFLYKAREDILISFESEAQSLEIQIGGKSYTAKKTEKIISASSEE
jgi:CubicO group peptidase (beta-lactamase class C family)